MNSMPLLIEFFLLDILQANVCLLWGKNAVQQSYWPFPPEKIPCPTYFHFHLHGSYCCGGALFWGLCVLLWRNWVHSTGLAYLKAGRMPKDAKCRLSMQLLNFAIATRFSVVAVLGCIGAVKFIIEDIKTYKFFHDM